MGGAEFKDGQKVKLKKLGREGVVLGRTPGGKYRVGCGSMNLEVGPKDLEPWVETKSQKKAMKLRNHAPSVQGRITEERLEEVLDLHGLTVAEALPRVTHYIDKAILADADRVQILHGLGTGRLMEAIHKELRSCSVVKRLELDKNNPGVTWVYF